MKNNYIIDTNNGVVKIELNHEKLGKLYTTVDIDCLEMVNQYKTTWFISYNRGHLDGVKTKAQHNNIRKVVWLHRLIMNCPTNMVVDHINGDTLDNKKSNLRILSTAENATNIKFRRNSASGFTNILLEKDGKYRVRINGKNFGRYKTIDEALNVRAKHIKNIFCLRNK